MKGNGFVRTKSADSGLLLFGCQLIKTVNQALEALQRALLAKGLCGKAYRLGGVTPYRLLVNSLN